MNYTQIFYDYFHLKLNLETPLLCKWKILHATIKVMFRVLSNEILEILFKKVINDCNSNTKCVTTLVKLMGNTRYWASYNSDNVKRKFGLRSSSRSKSNHSTVDNKLISPSFSENPMFLQVAKSELFVSVTING